MADPTRVMAVGTVMVDVMAVGIPHVAEPGHVVYTPHGIEAHIGGHPINVAIDLARIGVPAPSIALVAAIGEGMYGSFVLGEIGRYDFETFLQRIPTHDTGRNMVLEVSGEDRRFHIDPGANWYLDAQHVAGAIARFDPQVFTIRPGYSGIDLDLVEILEPLESTLVLLDVMQPHPDRPDDLVIDALRHVDLVHCNEREALTVTGASSLEGAVAVFLEHDVGTVLVTSGERGARLITSALEIGQAGFDVDDVDATGSGDAFCSGVIEYLLRSDSTPTRDTVDQLRSGDLAAMLARAQAVGAAAATKPGCVAGVSKETIDGIWSDQGESVLASTEISRR